jgi:hypothetical protein
MTEFFIRRDPSHDYHVKRIHLAYERGEREIYGSSYAGSSYAGERPAAHPQDFQYRVYVQNIDRKFVLESALWIEDNISGKYIVPSWPPGKIWRSPRKASMSFYFNNPNDAMLFKLRFAGD